MKANSNGHLRRVGGPTICVVTTLALVGILASTLTAGTAAAESASRLERHVTLLEVYVEDEADEQPLLEGGYDLVEGRGDDYLLVIGTDETADELRDQGYRVIPRLGTSASPGPDRQAVERDAQPLSFRGGYRTVDEHEEHLTAVVSQHPDLARLVDYGDSWLKTQGRGGRDLLAVCITNQQAGDCELLPDSDKPRVVMMSAIHPRELATAEINWRLVDDLVEGYRSDPEITMMLDTTEVWIIPLANPDGRDIVELGGGREWQRKNANDSDTPDGCRSGAPFNQIGVDLNRNASTSDWGRQDNGRVVSDQPCSSVFAGPSPASEPEEQALESLFRSLWPDGRADTPGAGAPADTAGVFISLHSFSDFVLFPPGGTAGKTANDAGLRSMGFRMGHFNGYQVGTAPEILYQAPGATDDFVYEDLGVASYTYEVGSADESAPCGGFFPIYECIDNELWPENRDALLYAIKAAGSPYLTSRGPTVTDVQAQNPAAPGSAAPITAVADDDALATDGIERPQATEIVDVEYYLDQLPDDGGQPVPMAPSDGALDAPTEQVSASVATQDLAVGSHTVYVRARNEAGFWGPFTAASFDVAS